MANKKLPEPPPEFKAYREAGNTGPWNWDANAPAGETNTPAEQLEILAALRKAGTPRKK